MKIPMHQCIALMAQPYLFVRFWKLTRKQKILEKKLRHLIQLATANGLRYASGLVLASTRYINIDKHYGLLPRQGEMGKNSPFTRKCTSESSGTLKRVITLS